MSSVANRDAAKPADTNGYFNELRQAWIKPLKQTCTAKDIPRLATRIDVSTVNRSTEDATGETKEKMNKGKSKKKTSSASSASSSSNESRTRAIISVVRKLSHFFDMNPEPAIREAEINDQSKSNNPDLSGYVSTLFDLLGGDESPVVRVLKCCHQNILFIAIFELKSGVLKDVDIRDSRDENSWRIKITGEKGRVQITHQRQETLVHVPGQLMWEVSMTFDDTMTELCSASLRLTGLTLEKAAKASDRRVLAQKLSTGKLIIK